MSSEDRSEDRRDPNRDRNRIVRDPPDEKPMPDRRGINPTAAGGPATPVIPGTGGAQAGGGPHVGAQEGSVTGVLGMGTGAVGRPSAGMGDDREADEAADDDVSAGDEDRTGGIISERNVALFGTPPTARESEALYRAGHRDDATDRGKAAADHAKRRP
ncbi:MAG TPA: hypothetical protein VD978_28310 [Azospirillum sp.]|nr:hypothetical protein [Azospirillum sp.]